MISLLLANDTPPEVAGWPWETILPMALAGAVASLVTIFDLDELFYIPVPGKATLPWYGPRIWWYVRFWFWWGGFVLANGILAAVIYLPAREIQGINGLPPWLAGLLLGLSYSALIRSKVFTFDGVPVGFEAGYEKMKRFVFKRINKIATETRLAELQQEMLKTLPELTSAIKMRLHVNVLLTPEEKKQVLAWVLATVKDPEADETEKKLYLANYLLAGKLPSQ